MTTTALNFLVAGLAAVGLFFIVGSFSGWFARFHHIGRKAVLGGEDPSSSAPLAARLAQALSQVLPFQRRQDPVGRLLSRAGNPYEGVTGYYQRKWKMLLLFAAAGLAVSLLVGAGPLLSLLLSAGFALMGFFAPDSEVKERIKKRRQQLRREMAFMLDRVAFAVMAYGTFQEALARFNQMEAGGEENQQEPVSKPWRSIGSLLPGENPETVKRRMRMVTIGSTVSGMGGGLFAEYLNRMASLLLGSAGVQFETIRWQLDMHYPTSPELQNFLDIVEAGLRGTPMADRLLELTDALILDLEQEQREAGMKATSVVVLAAGAVLVPLLLVVGGPAFFLAISVFGG
ncbi:MAG: hypothetical protein JXA25_19235 [Anaerolineales bacterium]|nr:hypothetical protein [Anaerolineales bacterium]